MSEIINNAFRNIDPRNKKFIEKNMDIVEEVYSIMEQKGIDSQKELAALCGKKESELSKLLSGMQNMTLRSITALEVALGEDIILVSHKAKERFQKTAYFTCYKPVISNNTSTEMANKQGFVFKRNDTTQLKRVS